MANDLQFQTKLSFIGQFVRDLAFDDPYLPIAISRVRTWMNGNGQQQCNAIYMRRLTGSSSVTLDLDALADSDVPFGQSVDFARLRVLAIMNNGHLLTGFSSTTVDSKHVLISGTFIELIFNNAEYNLLQAGSLFFQDYPYANGWTWGSTDRFLTIDPESQVPMDVTVFLAGATS